MTTSGAIQRHDDDLALGTEIGRYRVEEPVGRGGMGTVYRTYDKKTNRNVALKLLAPGIAPALRERFLAECEAEANIRHENVMPVYDRGWLTDERPYFVMELLYEPITLGEIIELVHKGNLGHVHPRLRHWNDLRRLVGDVLLPICEGVAVANTEYAVQHRDLKPDNVLIDIRTRRAYLIDFGICRPMDEASEPGKIVGTPRFLSPEQATARTDARTDVWGLGALLRYTVTGEPPLAGTSPFSRADVQQRIAALTQAEAEARAAGQDAKARGYANRREQLEDPTLRVQEDLLKDATDGIYLPLPEGTSAGLRAIIDKAMAPNPEDRYADATRLVADLRTWLSGGGVQALSEAGRGGALVDWARRHLNRNVVRGIGTAVTLLLGWVLGMGLFRVTPPPPDHRADDARALAQAVGQDLAALVPTSLDDAPPAVGLLAERWYLERRARAAAERMRALGVQPDPDAPTPPAPETVTVRIAGWQPREWSVDDALHLPDTGERMARSQGSFPPGVYHLLARDPGGFFLRFVVPPAVGLGISRRDGGLGRTIALEGELGEVPTGMTWVPAGRPAPGDDRAVPAFMASVHLVTNENYSEWLDDLSADERASRVPPVGFRRDRIDTRRWLAEPALAGKPVRGVKPADAAAYAAWRSNAEGVTFRLPTALEYQRMAAADQVGERAADPIFPWRRATSDRAAVRRGEGKRPSGEDLSPFGVRRLFSGGGEIVSMGAGFGVKAAGGIVPTLPSVTRTEPLAPDAGGHAYGFRLVHAR